MFSSIWSVMEIMANNALCSRHLLLFFKSVRDQEWKYKQKDIFAPQQQILLVLLQPPLSIPIPFLSLS